jgi:hypothetical protein
MRVLSFEIVSRVFPVVGFRVAALALSTVIALSTPREASACGGPCSVPELWSLQPTSQSTVVISNFGIIGQDQDGWVLACEEHIGGILLDVKAAGEWLVALTDSGVWLSHDGVCSWQQGPTSERSTWFLDSAVGPASTGSPELLVLAPNAAEKNTNLERANGDVFDCVRSIPPSRSAT